MNKRGIPVYEETMGDDLEFLHESFQAANSRKDFHSAAMLHAIATGIQSSIERCKGNNDKADKLLGDILEGQDDLQELAYERLKSTKK